MLNNPNLSLTRCISILAILGAILAISPNLYGGKSVLRENETIVFLGDSITSDGAEPGGFVTLVSEALAQAYPEKGIQVVGAGVGGDKVADLLERLDSDVLSKDPSIVVVLVGINDVWHWTKPHPKSGEKREGTNPEDYETGLRNLIQRVQAANARVILCTPTVIGEDENAGDPNYQMLEDFSRICRNVARETGSQLLDLRKAFVTYLKEHNIESASSGILTGDSVHLSSAGEGLVAKQILIALNVPTVDSYKGCKEDLHVYLLIGQSNMAGRARIKNEYQGAIENTYLLNYADQWAPAENPLNRFSTVRKEFKMQELNPGYSFAKRMLEEQPGISVGLIVNAKGGSKIQSWGKGTRFYREAIRRTRIAQRTGTLKGILWHQGEGNRTDAEYLEKLMKRCPSLRGRSMASN